MTNRDPAYRILTQTLNELGMPVEDHCVALDYGCGGGDLVYLMRNNNINAFGCDIEFKPSENKNKLIENGFIRLMDNQTYNIPFEDNFFDMVVSNQVFEHVQDYNHSFKEIKRVLKPGGVSLHYFPSKYRIIESHVKVPFATIIQNKYWLFVWAMFGFYATKIKKPLNFKLLWKIACKNASYLLNRTNYLNRKEIVAYALNHFQSIEFCEHAFIKFTPRNTQLMKWSKIIRFLPFLYSTFRTRVILLRKK